MTTPATPTLSLTALLSNDLLNDPAPLYRRLREEAPAHFDPAVGAWLISRYQDVLDALGDPRFSSERVLANLERQPPELREALRPIYQSIARQLMYVDPPTRIGSFSTVGARAGLPESAGSGTGLGQGHPEPRPSKTRTLASCSLACLLPRAA